MQIIWEEGAITDLPEMRACIAQFNPIAADELAKKIIKAADVLLENPVIGIAGRLYETRELVISGTSYTLIYHVDSPTISILRVFHQSRKWSNFI